MKQNEYQAGRPPFLRSQPGLLDFLYDSWVSACNTLNTLRSPKKETPALALASETPPELPSYVAFVDDDIVCVTLSKKTNLIDQFCKSNNVEVGNLFIQVSNPDFVGLKRDTLENLLAIATDIYDNQSGDWQQNAFAHDLLLSFEFLSDPRHNHQVSPIWNTHSQAKTEQTRAPL